MPATSGLGFPACDTIVVVGVGLIGGSLAGAVRQRDLARRVVGVGRDPRRLALARDLALVDEVCTSLAEAARDADLIAVCTPVDRIVADVREAARHCRTGTLITDAGSVKGPICRELAVDLPLEAEFVGSHPLAGGEKPGCEHADPNLFAGRRCVVTPVAESSPRAVDQISAFWQALGAQVLHMPPQAHDIAVARTSHVPHVAASALAATLRREAYQLAATGFRDTTRIASGDPGLWTSILLANSDEIAAGLREYLELLNDFRVALEAGDGPALRELLARGRESRERWRKAANESVDPAEPQPVAEERHALGN